MWTDLIVQSIEQTDKVNSRPIIVDLKPKRIRRGFFGASGTMTFNDDCYNYTVRMDTVPMP